MPGGPVRNAKSLENVISLSNAGFIEQCRMACKLYNWKHRWEHFC